MRAIMTFVLLLSRVLSTRALLCPQTLKIQSRLLNCAMAPHDLDFCFEQVSDRRRALDVMVFRGFSRSANEYMQQHKQENDETLSEQEAVGRLTPGVNEHGCNTNILGGPVFTFVAISHVAEFARTNGVVGAVDAKLTKECILLKNLHVDERVRRRGLASALVEAVKDFTRSTESVNEIVLNVDRQNINAIALYQKEGFEFDEQVKGDGRMVLAVPNKLSKLN